MPEYRVVVYGSMDGLCFPDLLVKYSTGFMAPLRIQQGERIPLDILDPLDVKKSLYVGSLGRHIANGAVVVEEDQISLPPRYTAAPNPIPSPTNINISHITAIDSTKPVSVPEIAAAGPTTAAPEQQLTSLSAVKTPEDFLKLTYFLKLRFIKECTDKAFLQSVLLKLDGSSKQLLNNLQLRISQLP